MRDAHFHIKNHIVTLFSSQFNKSTLTLPLRFVRSLHTISDRFFPPRSAHRQVKIPIHNSYTPNTSSAIQVSDYELTKETHWMNYSFFVCAIHVKSEHLRSRSFPRPCDGVKFIGIPKAYRLNGNARIECARLEWQQTGSICASPFRRDNDLWPILMWVCPFDDCLNGFLPWIWILSLHINWLREIYQFCAN